MKRRVMIAKALSHEPDVLFLDEPTAGVDVNLRRDMWALVRRLRDEGVTVILTTHYIEEAEEMADRVGVINHGRIVLVDEKAALMRKLGKRRLTLALQKPLPALPKELAGWPLELEDDGRRLSYRFDARPRTPACPRFCVGSSEIGVDFKDLDTTRRRSRTFSSIWWGGRRETFGGQSRRRLGDLPLRDAAHPAHDLAERGDAGDHHRALFRRVRRGDRLADQRSRRGELRRVHRARAHHALASDPKHLQRVDRHLLS